METRHTPEPQADRAQGITTEALRRATGLQDAAKAREKFQQMLGKVCAAMLSDNCRRVTVKKDGAGRIIKIKGQ